MWTLRYLIKFIYLQFIRVYFSEIRFISCEVIHKIFPHNINITHLWKFCVSLLNSWNWISGKTTLSRSDTDLKSKTSEEQMIIPTGQKINFQMKCKKFSHEIFFPLLHIQTYMLYSRWNLVGVCNSIFMKIWYYTYTPCKLQYLDGRKLNSVSEKCSNCPLFHYIGSIEGKIHKN